MRSFLASLLCLLVTFPAAAHRDIHPTTSWSQPYFTRIEVTFQGGSFHARWDISRCACGDLHIRAEETLPGELRQGEQLLLGSDVLLVRGYDSYEGPVAALLDSPVLMMQLLFVLLQKVEPAGPGGVSGMLLPDISEPEEPILLDSGFAYGGFPAPWSVKGEVTPAEAASIRYELNFSFTLPDTSQQQIHLSGTLDYAEQPFPIGDSLVLDGWSAAWLSLNTENPSGLTPGITLGEFKALGPPSDQNR